jgi:dihydrofolate synthase / folylpolyglutamate synthase
MDRIDPKYTEAVRYLYDRINYEKSTDRPYNQQTYRLGRMDFLLRELGSPHQQAPVIHIAGTKGKGSVSWLLAEAFRFSGRRVGLYTSPHLLHLEERFVVDGIEASPKEFVEAIARLKVAAEATTKSPFGQPTFFEMTTALAWDYFQQKQTDVNVIEVGLGGRLDSTNVCDSTLAIITSISFDHQQQLGNTISLIAAEKAGIIKRNISVVCGARHPDAILVIQNKCREMKCNLQQLGIDFEQDPNLDMKMIGAHQLDNGAVALAAWGRLMDLGWKLRPSAILESLSKTQVSCRIEVVHEKPTIVIDAAHNVASVDALIKSIESAFTASKRTIIFACSKDKEYHAMIRQFFGAFDKVIVTQFQSNPRTVPVERLHEIANDLRAEFPSVEVLAAPTCNIALAHARSTAIEGELICIAGSFFLAAEARAEFRS